MMRILVIGSGAREHSIVWKLAQSTLRPQISAAPGNPGMTSPDLAASVTRVTIAADDVDALLAYARTHHVDLTIVGPEAPLMAGIGDRFRAAGLPICGPDRAAARLEGSKSFAKDVMARAGVPTARHATFTNLDAARAYVRAHGVPIVVKADGLAAGKGVTVARTEDDALAALDDALGRGVFGTAGATVVVEEYLEGDELSVMALVAGTTYHLLPAAQDHKQVFDGDRGPNTGGMGAFAPVPWAGADALEMVRARVFTPLLAELARIGIAYRGILYAGLMWTADGPRVIEFNARLGDPETQVVLPLVEGDLAALCMAVAEGRLEQTPFAIRSAAAVGVVLAAPGYPGVYQTGAPISGLEHVAEAPETLVFHAGTRERDGHLVTAGGRVLTVVGLGHDLDAARARAYAGAERIDFAGKHARHDIGRRPRRVVVVSEGTAR
ncbi:MAG TPA: phosphoribosylamine--glycine ligase [Ktedonobacterales bacterium]